MESVYLVGSEDVQRAASTISSAAEDMRRAAASIEDSLHRHGLALDEHAGRIEEAVRSLEKFQQVRPHRCDETYERYVLGKWHQADRPEETRDPHLRGRWKTPRPHPKTQEKPE